MGGLQATSEASQSHQRGTLEREGVGELEGESGEAQMHGGGKSEGGGGRGRRQQRPKHHEFGCG